MLFCLTAKAATTNAAHANLSMFHLSQSKHIDLARIYEKGRNLAGSLPPIKKKREKKFFKFFKILLIFTAVIIIGLVLFLVLNLASFKLIYANATAGKDNAEYAVSLIKEKNYVEANSFALLAQNNFQDAIVIVKKYQDNFIIQQIRPVADQFNDLAYLLLTGKILCQAITQGSDLAVGVESFFGAGALNFAKLGREEKRNILEKIYTAGPELKNISESLNFAFGEISKIKYAGILRPFKGKIAFYKDQFNEARLFLANAIPMSELLPPLFGYPDKSAFLFILQNSDELRPTGGFIGTYGILEVDSGDIMRFDTHDVYHMDMPVKDKLTVAPPEPLAEYLGVEKWYLRDANWSPDWPAAAEKIRWFFNEEDKLLPAKDQINNFNGSFSGVIGITPKLITDLLALIGPIYIGEEEFNEHNFIKLLQYKVEKGYAQLGIPSWHRKKIIGEILKELKLKIFALPAKKLYEAVNILEQNLDEKNILLSFRDKAMAAVADEQGWDGKVMPADGDYLMVVDANMASLKTDAVMARSINYKVEQSVAGLFADLRLNYAHNGDFNWQTTRYRTYTRVYAPFGSELIAAEGISEGEAEVYNELGKTVFAGFISVEPGEIGQLHFYYKLPMPLHELAKQKKYELYIQKQPGKKAGFLALDLEFMNKIQSYSPSGFYIYKIGDSSINWEADLKTDKIFLVNF